MKKLFLIALLCTFSCSSFFKKDTYYGIDTSNKRIVFVVDVSGSMDGNNEGNISDKLRAQAMGTIGSAIGNRIGGTFGSAVSSGVQSESTKLASAKRELKPAIMGLKDTSSFTVIVFSDNIRSWKAEVQKATDSSKALGYTFVSSLKTEGGTNALAGLKKAFSIKGVDTIFFLSDGQPSDASPDEILANIEKLNKNKKVTVHTIGLGDDKDEDFLKALAEQNGGNYIEG